MIFETAKQLGMELHDGEAYQKLIKAQEAMDADTVASELVQRINETEKSIRSMMEAPQADQQKMAELMQEYRSLHEAADSNEVIQNYTAATQEFQAIMEQVNQIIQFQMTGQISASCSGNCATCGSCH